MTTKETISPTLAEFLLKEDVFETTDDLLKKAFSSLFLGVNQVCHFFRNYYDKSKYKDELAKLIKYIIQDDNFVYLTSANNIIKGDIPLRLLLEKVITPEDKGVFYKLMSHILQRPKELDTLMQEGIITESDIFYLEDDIGDKQTPKNVDYNKTSDAPYKEEPYKANLLANQNEDGQPDQGD